MKTLPERIEDFERRSEQFLEERSEEYYRTGTGLSDKSNIAAIYERYKDLTSLELFEDIRGLLAGQPKGEPLGVAARRRLQLLLSFAGNVMVGEATREIEDERITFESNATVRLPWSEEGATPYRLSAVLLQNEPDAEKRKIIDDSRRVVHRQLTPIIARLLETAYATFARLGYPQYADAIQQLERIDLYELRDVMTEFLAQSEDRYGKALSACVEKRLGILPERAHKRDIGYLFRAPGFDDIFPADKLIPAAEQTLNKMGLDLYAGGRIRLDMEKRPKKSPRAFCVTLKPPERVVLVTMPSGGLSDYGAFLHELGHALHFANVAADAPFEYRWLGDNSVTESFAMLFEHLLLNRVWLTDYLGNVGADRIGDYEAHAHLQLCYMVRRYAGKLVYELALHGPEREDHKAALYKKILTDACLVEYPEGDYLVDLDMHFYCARYLRAWLFEARLSSFLEKEFGENWFHSRSAGTFLLELWKDGQKFALEELEGRLGFKHLDSRPLMERVGDLA